jgi:hypothetical protein
MSRPAKVTLVLLALFVLLFAALTVWGLRQPQCEGTREACARGYEPHRPMKWLGGVLSGAAPKARLPQPRYTLPQGARLALDIGPSDDKMRTLALRLSQGVAAVHLVPAPGPPDDDLGLQEQAEPSALPREGAQQGEDARATSFVVPRAGGRLHVECRLGPCTLEQPGGR